MFRHIVTTGGLMEYCRYFDTNKDGKISKAEFQADPYKYRALVFKNADFSVFDRDGDGFVTVADMRQLTKPLLDAVDSENFAILDRWAETAAGVNAAVLVQRSFRARGDLDVSCTIGQTRRMFSRHARCLLRLMECNSWSRRLARRKIQNAVPLLRRPGPFARELARTSPKAKSQRDIRRFSNLYAAKWRNSRPADEDQRPPPHSLVADNPISCAYLAGVAWASPEGDGLLAGVPVVAPWSASLRSLAKCVLPPTKWQTTLPSRSMMSVWGMALTP